jgi:hypothetical protein
MDTVTAPDQPVIGALARGNSISVANKVLIPSLQKKDFVFANHAQHYIHLRRVKTAGPHQRNRTEPEFRPILAALHVYMRALSCR